MVRQPQQGQALPLGIVLILFAVLGSLVLFNTGQTATEKARLANTADAAAYSGLLWQARSLNFQAYTNRAMVANQVSIAQAVSIQSWVRYAAITSENVSTVTAWIPVVNGITKGVSDAVNTIDSFLKPIGDAMVLAIDVVNKGLSLSQEAMFASSFVATPEIVSKVVESNDPRFEADTAYSLGGSMANLDAWRTFTDRYDPDVVDDRPEVRSRARLINDSRDEFSEARDWDLFSGWLYTTPLTRHKLIKQGETRLVERVNSEGELEFEWKAKDTLQLNNRIELIIKTRKINLPVGWGEAIANQDGTATIERGACDRRTEFFDRDRDCVLWTRNGVAERLADVGTRFIGKESLIVEDTYQGLNAFRSLSEDIREQEEPPRLKLRVEVALPTDRLVGSDTRVSGDTLAAPIVAPGQRISSISVAEVYYQRPDEDTRATAQRANLYNPYWDVRLAPIAESERALALALRSGGGPSAVVPGALASAGTGGNELGSYHESGPTARGSADGTDSTADDVSPERLAELYPDANATALSREQAHMASLTAGDRDALLGSADTEFDNPDEWAGLIEEQVADQLEQAVTKILGRVGDGIRTDSPDDVKDRVRAQADDLASRVEGEVQDLEAFRNTEAYREAVAQSEEFERIHVEVKREYEPIANETLAFWDVLIDPIKANIEAERDLGPDADPDRVRELRHEMLTHQHALVDELTEELVDVVNAATSLWDITAAEARELVEGLIALRDRSPDQDELIWEIPHLQLEDLEP